MSEVNADQQTYWSDKAGPYWVARMAPMDQTLGPVLDAVLAAAALTPGDQVLDIGCGAGTSTIAAAQQVGPSGQVVGVDISESLLAKARQIAEGTPQAGFLLADAQTHAFDDGHIDCILSRFGVMFFDDPEAAFINMAKALRPGGRMAFASWGAISENPYFTLPARTATGIFGPVPKTDPDDPGPFAFRETARVTGILEAAGMVDIDAKELPMDLTPPGDAAAVADVLCDIGSAHRILTHFEATPDMRAQLVAALAEALQVFETEQGLRIPALINIFTARKPA